MIIFYHICDILFIFMIIFHMIFKRFFEKIFKTFYGNLNLLINQHIKVK